MPDTCRLCAWRIFLVTAASDPKTIRSSAPTLSTLSSTTQLTATANITNFPPTHSPTRLYTMDSDGSSKRRRLNDSSSSPFFVTQLPEPNLFSKGNFATTEKDETFLTNDFDTLSDDGSDDQPEDTAYNESNEPFPAYHAFDKAVVDLNSRAKSSVQKLHDVLGQYAFLSADLKNMQLKAEETLESRTPEPRMIGFVGATGAGMSRSIPWRDNVLTMVRQELTAHVLAAQVY